jgi:FkbM family methyltransferase
MSETPAITPDYNDLVLKINEIVSRMNNNQKALSRQALEIQRLRLQNELLAGVSGSSSQFNQDLFVLKETQYKRGGFFVEFGATNGVEGSNSYFLEKDYGWSGILAEPAKCWANALAQNRKAHIDHRCVWVESGQKIEFHEAEVATLSTLSLFKDSDMHTEARSKGATYVVETVSLLDLLEQHGAPKTIDYLSIDTEGSELAILSAFDFSKYDVRIISCEHNWTADRDAIFALLTSKGYTLKHKDLTDCDDWYVKTGTPSV